MSESIIDISRQFFTQVVKPILEEHFPEETQQIACGVFGYGSEALRLDDDYSRDHHWGLRIDALMPDEIFQHKREEMMQVISRHLPATFQVIPCEKGMAGAGLAPRQPVGLFSPHYWPRSSPANLSGVAQSARRRYYPYHQWRTMA
ncbi:MAG: hypothetical protein U0401_17380 [Anaerolineae bacterium]